MPSYPFMPMYGAPMPGAWAPPFPGSPYGPVLAAPPAESAKIPSTAPPKPPAVASAKASSTKKSPATEEKVAAIATGVHYVSLHPTVAKLRSVKCGESSPGGNRRTVTIEEWQKFCNATDGTKKVNPESSLKSKKLETGPPEAKAKSVQSADVGGDFDAFLEWNQLRKEAKKAAEAAQAKLAVKVDKTASSEVVKAKSAPPPTSEQSPSHSTHSYNPPTLRPGVNYLFPEKKEHTMLHIFNKTSKLWADAKYAQQAHQFKIFKTPTHLSVASIIERVRRGEGKGWAITEVVEGGSGGWKKGTTIGYDDEKAKGTLESMGWDQTRGSEGRPPVWLVVHKEA